MLINISISWKIKILRQIIRERKVKDRKQKSKCQQERYGQNIFKMYH